MVIRRVNGKQTLPGAAVLSRQAALRARRLGLPSSGWASSPSAVRAYRRGACRGSSGPVHQVFAALTSVRSSPFPVLIPTACSRRNRLNFRQGG